MELRMFFDGEFSPPQLLSLSPQDFFQVGDCHRRGMESGTMCQGRLEHLVNVQEFADHLPLLPEKGGKRFGVTETAVGSQMIVSKA
jgi:hypothetical protein